MSDLKTLIRLGKGADDMAASPSRVFAPWSEDPALQERIDQLREAGSCVVCGLPGQQGGALEMGCTQQLVHSDGSWQLISV